MVWVAKIISAIFHPLLMVTYLLLIMMITNPYLFPSLPDKDQVPLVPMVFFSTFLMPGLAILMMKKLDMISSLQMPEKQERIGPFILTGAFYIAMVVYFYNNSQNIPLLFTAFMLGSTIGLFSAFIINIFFKISIHSTGAGGMVAVLFIMLAYFSSGEVPLTLPGIGSITVSMMTLFIMSILLAGLIATSRLILKAHTLTEVFSGLSLGFVSMMIGYYLLF